MGQLYILLDEIGLDETGLDEMAINLLIIVSDHAYITLVCLLLS